MFWPRNLHFSKTNHAGRIVNQYDIAILFASVYLRMTVIQNAKCGFHYSIVLPFNSNIFSDTDYVPASVTDHPYRDCTPASPTHSHNLNSLSYVQTLSLSRTSTGLTTDGMTHCDQPKSGPSTIYSPHDILPCQTAQKTVNTGWKRKCKWPEILPSTPVQKQQRDKFEKETKSCEILPKTQQGAFLKIVLPTKHRVILIEDIPLCFNSKSKTKCFKLSVKTVQQCINVIFVAGEVYGIFILA